MINYRKVNRFTLNRLEKAKFKYELAIDARNKMNDDFHKWMTFYYLANAAVVVAITTLYAKCVNSVVSALFLAIVGIIISVFWNLSCKGYYYWSSNWIKLIKKFEEDYFGEKAVYGVFMNEVHEQNNSLICLTKGYNVSTPKLTMIFSFLSIVSWIAFASYIIFSEYGDICCTFVPTIITFLIYMTIPEYTVSRKKNHNKLI